MNESILSQILDGREKRAEQQKKLLAAYRLPLICFTMNIPDERKTSPLSRLAFRSGCGAIERALGKPKHFEAHSRASGDEAFFVYDRSADDIKCETVKLEERSPVGRLFDMDVLTADGKKLSREIPRRCLICDAPAADCVKSGRHTRAQAADAAGAILCDFAAGELANMAVSSLLEEVWLSPKPGLVDARNCGAHTDMDLPLFEKSAEALRPYFRTAALCGMAEEDCMPRLQKAGADAEKIMLEATYGVNTHKGAIYAFGLMLAAMGSHLAFGSELFSQAALLASSAAASDTPTHGSEMRKKYRGCGAKKEALDGFPNAISAYNILCETNEPLRALLWLMASVPDTNLLYRGGMDGLIFVQESAKKLLHLPKDEMETGLVAMDEVLIEKNLSPGGAADLLALAIFLKKTEHIWDDE